MMKPRAEKYTLCREYRYQEGTRYRQTERKKQETERGRARETVLKARLMMEEHESTDRLCLSTRTMT